MRYSFEAMCSHQHHPVMRREFRISPLLFGQGKNTGKWVLTPFSFPKGLLQEEPRADAVGGKRLRQFSGNGMGGLPTGAMGRHDQGRVERFERRDS